MRHETAHLRRIQAESSCIPHRSTFTANRRAEFFAPRRCSSVAEHPYSGDKVDLLGLDGSRSRDRRFRLRRNQRKLLHDIQPCPSHQFVDTGLVQPRRVVLHLHRFPVGIHPDAPHAVHLAHLAQSKHRRFGGMLFVPVEDFELRHREIIAAASRLRANAIAGDKCNCWLGSLIYKCKQHD